jgi:tetratricopeptide (TPR) repeat protein
MWPIVSGAVPPLAVGHIDRPESGLRLAYTLAPGETVVLADGADGPIGALGGLGGTGKTQLAVAAAQALRESQAIDLLLWVHASSRASILTSYAHASGQVGTAGRNQDPESDARQLLDWLAGTIRPWLAVLDGLLDFEDLDGLWPQGPAGRTLVTAGRSHAALPQAGRRIEYVGVFSRREAFTYIRAGVDRDLWAKALDLVDDLGCFPLGLGQAAAVMASEQLGCHEYRGRLSQRKAKLTGQWAQGYPAIVVASWWLALDGADQLPPPRMARPALSLAALLGANGIPGAVLTSKTACGFITGRASAGEADEEIQARHALHNLASLGLVTIDGNVAARTIYLHSLVRAVVLDSLPAEQFRLAAMAAASSLLEVWPEQDQAEPLLAQALRDCASSLQAVSGELLWDAEVHPVLIRAGQSLDAAQLTGPAARYWRVIAEKAADILGPDNPDTFRARERLGSALVAAGLFDDAIEVRKGTLAERERLFGPGHPDSFASRFSLAAAYQAAGRPADAIPLYEKSVAEQAWLLGGGHPDTWISRSSLASAYQAAGRSRDAIPLYEQTVSDAEQIREPGHPDILAARRDLAGAYQAAGLSKEAIRTYERFVLDTERSSGPDHPDTRAARGIFVAFLLQTRHGKDAIRHSKRNLADVERAMGPLHPDTLTARATLADAHLLTGHLREAIALYERTLAEREQCTGPADPETVTLRASLASAYHSAGRLAHAIPLYKQAIADSDLLRGASHPDTVTLRGNLAHAYHTVGRPSDALALLERTLADCERYLGPDDPLTQTVRENYHAISSE